MCKKKTMIKKQYTMGLEFSFTPTREISRDKAIEKRAYDLFDRMSKEFAIGYRKAVIVLLDKEETEHRDKKYWEDVMVKSSIRSDVTFGELLESLKD